MEEIKDMGSIPGSEDPLEEGMATHSSILALIHSSRESSGKWKQSSTLIKPESKPVKNWRLKY